jgi:hypothetical protein
MSQSDADSSKAHNEAYTAFVEALADPAKRAAAKNNPILGPVLQKLSDNDLEALKTVAIGQTLTNHGHPFEIPDANK